MKKAARRNSLLAGAILSLLLCFSGCNEELLAYIQNHKAEIQNGDYMPLLEAYLKSSSASYNQAGQSLNSVGILEKSLAENERACPVLYEGPPRGLACLHCTQEEAQSQANNISLLLERSCLKNIAINYLIDGSFGIDYPFLFSQIATLSSGGRTLHLLLYYSNGPSQRQWKTTKVKSFSTEVSPNDFRSAIATDSPVRRQFIRNLKNSLPLLYFASYRGAKLYLVPMLEDNLDDESFQLLAKLMSSTLPKDLPYKLGRNPCPGCFQGNGRLIPRGMFQEAHTISPSVNVKGGIVTNDGVEYESNERQGPVTLDLLTGARDRAGDQGSVFILWSGKRQGLKLIGNDLIEEIKAPAERNYVIPSYQERIKILDFLRAGIAPEY